MFSGIVYFREIIVERSRNVSETTPSPQDIYILGLMDVFGVNILDVLKTLPWGRFGPGTNLQDIFGIGVCPLG